MPKSNQAQTQSQTKAPTHRLVANISPEGQPPFWREFGAAWPSKSDPEKLVIKLSATPVQPGIPLILVVNTPK